MNGTEDQGRNEQRHNGIPPVVDHPEDNPAKQHLFKNRHGKEQTERLQLRGEIEMRPGDAVASGQCHQACNDSEIQDTGQQSQARILSDAFQRQLRHRPMLRQIGPDRIQENAKHRRQHVGTHLNPGIVDQARHLRECV